MILWLDRVPSAVTWPRAKANSTSIKCVSWRHLVVCLHPPLHHRFHESPRSDTTSAGHSCVMNRQIPRPVSSAWNAYRQFISIVYRASKCLCCFTWRHLPPKIFGFIMLSVSHYHRRAPLFITSAGLAGYVKKSSEYYCCSSAFERLGLAYWDRSLFEGWHVMVIWDDGYLAMLITLAATLRYPSIPWL